MKSNKDSNLSHINNLDKENKLHKNKTFNLWSESSTFSNNLVFLSFQIIQKRHKGATLQTSFLFLPTKVSCQPKRVSLTKEWITMKYQKERTKVATTPSSCYNAKDVVNWLLVSVTQETSIGRRPTSPL